MRGVIAARKRVGIEVVRGRPQRHDAPLGTGERDARRVGVVVRLERDDLVAGFAQGEQRGGDRFGRARGHEHLGVGVELEPVEAVLVRSDRGPERGNTDARRILVVPGADRVDRGLLDRLGTVGVREPLSEVDRPRRQRERRHLGEDRRPEALHPGVQVPVHRHHCTSGRRALAGRR